MAKKNDRSSGLKGLQALAALKANLPNSDSPDQQEVEQVVLPKLTKSPLQELRFQGFSQNRDRELPESIFVAAIAAEDKSAEIYQFLEQRIKELDDQPLKISFPWRLRVGGLPGFRDLLLPAMHPIYGVPYIPASSLKGVVRAWAEQQDEAVQRQVRSMLGYLDGQSQESQASIGKVQFLDAFPMGKCLSMDMANPQWHWSDQQVNYNPEPHALLSLENVILVIGLKATYIGSNADVETVKSWISEALKYGLGSRSSAGYGRARGQINSCSSVHSFKLWSQGMYGATPPTKLNGYRGEVEFRPAAVRGTLRYWLRTIALGLYDTETAKSLENKLFGSIQPTAVRGSFRLSIDAEELGYDPFHVSGKIRLEAESDASLQLMQSLLVLSASIGGIGRGSRRPLHWNNRQLRGCHWELEKEVLAADSQAWGRMLLKVRSNLELVVQEEVNANPQSPTYIKSNQRTQDILNLATHIYLMKSSGTRHPKSLKDNEWGKIGASYTVIGAGLQLLYSSGKYKGRSIDISSGNPYVGGAVNQQDGSIPSFVLIKSMFPITGDPYQVITIFDAEGHSDRQAFAKAVKNAGGIQVWPIASR